MISGNEKHTLYLSESDFFQRTAILKGIVQRDNGIQRSVQKFIPQRRGIAEKKLDVYLGIMHFKFIQIWLQNRNDIPSREKTEAYFSRKLAGHDLGLFADLMKFMFCF